MTFGLETTDSAKTTVRVRGIDNIKPFLETFHKFGHTELDTARIYCLGDTETALGLLPTDDFKIATKVWPTIPGSHGPEHLGRIFRESLAALKADKVDILYLHSPDYTTPFEVTIREIDALYREGLFERFGLSNFAAWQVTLIHQMCKQNGYVLPTVYQGMYNGITRDVVRELLPCLKALKINFYAYNPIAGGLLSGRYRFDENDSEGRFDVKTGYGKIYRDRYWNNLFFEAVRNLTKAAEENHLTLLEASLRWMVHHSGLGPNDGIIIGASSLHHLEDNLKELAKGPLPEAMVTAFDEAWEHVKVACAPYFKDEVSAKFISAVNTK
ncbi:Aflatoxin B1 aldehyde reductase member 2 [Haplosporangium bisporale]|nr:Aflatoxin B1 aldehyde reductase member 2 [Haplosporangium bisporale]